VLLALLVVVMLSLLLAEAVVHLVMALQMLQVSVMKLLCAEYLNKVKPVHQHFTTEHYARIQLCLVV
tara:strand:+ start:401 stop:601 length:201 start_codon:yes stop_codon:yes gene_type:complete